MIKKVFYIYIYIYIYFFSLYKKWIAQLIIKQTEIILNRARDYYENDKERLRERARNKYRNSSEEDKNKKGEYGKKIDTIICLK